MNININHLPISLTGALTLLSLIVCSCSSPCQDSMIGKNGEPYKIEMTDMKDSLELHYSDLFSSVRYIELSDNPTEAIISSITKLEITQDGDLVIFDRDKSKIVRYDSNGLFLNLIGEKGLAPNEYINLEAIAYDKFDNQVLAYDAGKRKILCYTLEGKMVKSISVPYLSAFSVVDKDHLILYNDYIMKEPDFNYVIIDKEGKEEYKIEKINNILEGGPYPSTGSVFNRLDNGELLCWSFLSTTIFKLENGQEKHFAEIIPPSDDWSVAGPDKTREANENSKKKKLIHSMVYINNHFLLTGYNIQDGYTFFYWTDLQGHGRGGQTLVNDMTGLYPLDYILGTNGKNLYCGLLPFLHEPLLKQWKERQDIPQSDKDLVSKLANSANPIIQVCTVK